MRVTGVFLFFMFRDENMMIDETKSQALNAAICMLLDECLRLILNLLLCIQSIHFANSCTSSSRYLMCQDLPSNPVTLVHMS